MASRRTTAGPRSRGNIARRQEEDTAIRLGGRRVPGSGNQWYASGDVRVSDLVLIENKFTDQLAFSLTQTVVQKIQTEARGEGCDYWAVEIWIRPQSLKVYAVCTDLVLTAQQFGLVLSDPEDITVNQKSLRFTQTRFGRDPWIWVRTEWGLGGLDFYLVGKERMETLVDTVRNPSLRRYLDLSKCLYYYYSDYNRKPNERSVGVVGGSDLGKCKLRSWYRLVGTEPKPIFTPETRMRFVIGHLLHDKVQADLALLFGHQVFSPEVLVELPDFYFRGSADGTFDVEGYGSYDPPEWLGEEALQWAEGVYHALADGARLMVEIKTCSRLPANPMPGHMRQAIAYGKILGMTDVCFLYLNKASGQIVGFIRSIDNPIVWGSIQEELAYLKEKADALQPPPRELSRSCGECEYKWICQPPGH